MTEFSQKIEDPLFISTGKYLRTLVRHDGNLERALLILTFAVNIKIFGKDLLEPCRIQLGVLKDRVEKGKISRASDAEMKAMKNVWMHILVRRILKGMK